MFRLIAILSILLIPEFALAHFVWVSIETEGGKPAKAQVYFSEAPHPDRPEFLAGLSKLKLWHRTDVETYAPIKASQVTNDQGGVLASSLKTSDGLLEADCVYGIFSRRGAQMLLHYYAKAVTSSVRPELARSKRLGLDIVPHLKGNELQLSVFWQQKPAENATLHFRSPTGTTIELKTDAKGVARRKIADAGRYELRARVIVPNKGEYDGEGYDDARHYCTVTYDVNSRDLPSPKPTKSTPENVPAYPKLVRGLTSFGGAVLGESLYIYGGHFGRPHHYSDTSQSDELLRLSLTDPKGWEIAARGPRLQGLALVAHGNKLYRVGGFTAHNKEGDDHDLRSVNNFESFDPKTGKWNTLPELPDARSSHDAVVLGDHLYVVGGWQLGAEKPTWHKAAWVVDLSQEKLEWKALPEPPFQRRALSLAHHGGKIYVLGGMTMNRKPTLSVDIFDPATKKWSKGPELEGRRMDGFGSSAFTVDGRLYVSTYYGNLQVLSSDGSKFEIQSELDDDRFFHRMLPLEKKLLVVGGASMKTGKNLNLEVLEPVTK
ncbi:MAG: DUF4198 domain-containing protein [Planctomycetota bacterium]